MAYARPRADRGGLRLHLNEHTGGCSPRVLERLRALDASAAALYPDYDAALDAAARWFGVAREQLILTNGLDEGLLAATILAVRGSGGEGIVVEPAFDMYHVCLRALGARTVRVRLERDFSLNVDRLLEAVTPQTRIIFVNEPHNPTGARVPAAALERIAREAPNAILFVDEAYAEFSGDSFIAGAVASRNVLVGRTFAKAYGLAGLRAGAVIGPEDAIAALADIVPPYSLNAYAAEALAAALDDRAHIDAYIAEAARSRELIAAACARLGLHAHPSAANFVLVHVGPNASAIADALAERGIFVRDRSGEPGCEGCFRMTAGRVQDTTRALAALEEIVCAAR
jgi:histidinol-phosphate aminotransferase